MGQKCAQCEREKKKKKKANTRIIEVKQNSYFSTNITASTKKVTNELIFLFRRIAFYLAQPGAERKLKAI